MSWFENPSTRFWRTKERSRGPPLLVQEGIGPRPLAETPYYYIVPFGFSHDFAEGGSQLTRGVVLVNAFDGAFEEVTAFGQPIRYLSRREALAVVASVLHRDYRQLKDMEATLRFEPGEITHIRAYPFWEIKLRDRSFSSFTVACNLEEGIFIVIRFRFQIAPLAQPG